jgi:signal transduction histidine kinase
MSDMSEVVELERGRRRLDRWMAYLPYGALACSAVLVPISGASGTYHWPYPIIALLVAVTAVWMVRFRRGSAVHFAVLVALIYLLVFSSPFFGFFAWTGYLYTGWVLDGRKARLIGATSVAFITAFSQAGGMPLLIDGDGWGFFAVLLLFNLTIANAMTILATMGDEQAAKRAQMIEELARANEALAAALKENEGLHAQLLTQAREAGVLDERQRMAGEIHDVLAQGLTGIVTQLEAASAVPSTAGRHIETAKTLARESLAEARRSVQALRPQPLDSAALPSAVEEVVNGWSALNGVPASLIVTGTARPLLPEIETTLLRTAQEALANVARHAFASRVFLTLSYMGDLVTLDVRDDGAGFDASVPPSISDSGGYGLVAMRERLRRIAGTLEVESEPGNGTALSACVPALTLGAAA